MEISKVHLSDGTEDRRPRTPWESFLLAYAAMVPILVGAVACLLLRGGEALVAEHLTVVWSGAVLCFLAGVRRGLSFRQEGGPLVSQLGVMLWLFVLGVGSLVSPFVVVSVGLQMVGYATMGLLDPGAARAGEVPLYFRRLRPVQMLVPIAGLAVVLGRVLG